MIHAVCFPIDHPFHSWPVFHLLEFLSIIIPIRSWSLFLRVYLLHPFCPSGNSFFLSSLPYFVSACTPVHNFHMSGYKHVIGLTFDTSSPSSLSSITILPTQSSLWLKGELSFTSHSSMSLFSRTLLGTWSYHLSSLSNPYFPDRFRRIARATLSCLFLYSFCNSFGHTRSQCGRLSRCFVCTSLLLRSLFLLLDLVLQQ